MELPKRLQQIAFFVEQGDSLADVGTDHGLLPVFLVLSGKIKRAIATDIASGPCQAARNTIRRHGLNEAIEVRLGPGLAPLQRGEVNTLVLAGMGGSTALSILTAHPEIAQTAHRWIVQPMNNGDKLRAYFRSLGFPISDETWLEENGRLYQVMTVCTVRDVGTSEALYRDYTHPEAEWFAYSFGPLAVNRSGLVEEAVVQTKKQLMDIVVQLARGRNPVAVEQRSIFQRRLNWLTEWLKSRGDVMQVVREKSPS